MSRRNSHDLKRLFVALCLILHSVGVIAADEPRDERDEAQKAFNKQHYRLQNGTRKELFRFAAWCRANGLDREVERIRQDIRQLGWDPSRPPKSLQKLPPPEIVEKDAVQEAFRQRQFRKYSRIIQGYLALARAAVESDLYGSADQLLLAVQILSRMDPRVKTAAREMTEDFPIRVMSFNLLVPGVPWEPHPLDQRKGVIQHCIEALRPDVVGTQETSKIIIRHLGQTLPDHYKWITISSITKGKVRQGKDSCAILYNASRLRAEEADYSLLSETMPTKLGRSGFGASHFRMIIWARFTPIGSAADSGESFYFYNTHLEPYAKAAPVRAREITGITTRVFPLHPENATRVFTGDFNEGRIGSVGDALRRHEFDGHWKGIDWIVSSGLVRILDGTALNVIEQGIIPSDHRPVIGYLDWKPTPPE